MRALILSGALVASAPAVAQAPDPKAGTPPTAQELAMATDTLSVFVSALNAKDIPAPTKEGLLMCFYDNPLGAIAARAAKVFAANKTADPKSPSQRLFVIASLCHAPLPGLKAGK